MTQPEGPRFISSALPPGHDYQDADEPQVVLFFRLYSGLVSFSGVGMALFGVFKIAQEQAAGRSDLGGWMVMVGLGALGFFSHLLGLLTPRKPWMHLAGILILGMGMLSSCLGWVFNIPLLLLWLKPEVKRWFDSGG